MGGKFNCMGPRSYAKIQAFLKESTTYPFYEIDLGMILAYLLIKFEDRYIVGIIEAIECRVYSKHTIRYRDL